MRLLLERARLPHGWADDVLVEIEDGRFTRVDPGGSVDGAERVRGLTVPGLANCHSHAFHRALRGRTQRERGSFWTWREQMYAVAGRLDPDSCYALARATYREMLAAGWTSVGEFHYLHHGPDGTPYDRPNAMGEALVDAARDTGIRIALLDTCYLSAGFGEPPQGVQVRYSDGDADAWADRVSGLAWPDDDGVVVGAAVHSVRAVPRAQLPTVVAWTAETAPLHVHLSEQVAENEACRSAHGMTPTRLLHEAGAIGSRTTAVHATHLTDDDVRLLGDASAYACFCPTTERDLGDGIGPSRPLHAAGARLTLGSDSHAVVDPFEEMRAVELDERLATRERGHWDADALLGLATGGHASLGFEGTGSIEPSARADLVTLDATSTRTAGTGRDTGSVVFAATGADVTQVVVDGRVVVREGDAAEIGRELELAIAALWKDDR